MDTNNNVEVLLRKLNEIARKLNINNDNYTMNDYINLINDIIVFSIRKIVEDNKVEDKDLKLKFIEILELLEKNHLEEEITQNQ